MLIRADARLIPLRDRSVHMVVTSPPYYGLRDYRTNGQIGLEASPEEYVAQLMTVFRELGRVLRDDGTVWLIMGDSYNGDRSTLDGSVQAMRFLPREVYQVTNLQAKNLLGIPWRVAFALQAAGWILRSDIIWHAPNKMPESVTDRPTKSHEYVFLLAKLDRYFYDAEAIFEPYADAQDGEIRDDLIDGSFWDERDPRSERRRDEVYTGQATKDYAAAGAQNPSDAKRSILASMNRRRNISGNMSERGVGRMTEGLNLKTTDEKSARGQRNKRTVWTVPTRPYTGAHYATFPPALIEPCILAGTSAYGCCGRCGAQWERIVVHQNAVISQTQRSSDKRAAGLRTAIGGTLIAPAKSITLDWRPTCGCGTSSVVPSIVFDPFIGSGTVGAVAERLGRRWIGVDLGYQNLATDRTAQRGLPFLRDQRED